MRLRRGRRSRRHRKGQPQPVVHRISWWYSTFVPTARPRIQVTETEALARALAIAARQWPGAPKSELVTRLAVERAHEIIAQETGEQAERRQLLAALRGQFDDATPTATSTIFARTGRSDRARRQRRHRLREGLRRPSRPVGAPAHVGTRRVRHPRHHDDRMPGRADPDRTRARSAQAVPRARCPTHRPRRRRTRPAGQAARREQAQTPRLLRARLRDPARRSLATFDEALSVAAAAHGVSIAV